MTTLLYDKGQVGQYNGGHAVDFDTDTIKLAFLTSSYVPNQATDEFWSGISLNEVSGTGYSAGGITLAGGAVSIASHVLKLDFTSPSTILQNAAGFSNGQIAVIYKDTGTAATSPLIWYQDMGASFGNVAGDLSFTFDANGIATLTL